MSRFIGREYELNKLEKKTQQKKAFIAVIKGRRRIGKSKLVEEFAKNKTFVSLSGIAPTENVTSQDQRDYFAGQYSRMFNLPTVTFRDWSDAFASLSLQIRSKKTVVILLDEISWMGSKDPTFIPKLKAWWDLDLQNKDNIVLVLCGSVSTWINDNIINSTAFFGRISIQINLQELSLQESFEFLKHIKFKGSHSDIFKILSVTGGVPWYLEQIYAHETAEQNIQRLCFEKDGILVEEFQRIFVDLFSSKGTIYSQIIRSLAGGMQSRKQIQESVKYHNSGVLSGYLKALVASGFISDYNDWSLKTAKQGRGKIYRLTDNYLRFYLKYIEPNMPKIQNNQLARSSITSLAGWKTIMGFQVENLLLKNRHLILEILGINGADIVADNPYIQRATLSVRGAQVDYLIQTHANNLFFCEFKFQTRELGSDIIAEVQEKISRFQIPRGYGVAPVLVHLGGVKDEVYNNNYFFRIIDLSEVIAW